MGSTMQGEDATLVITLEQSVAISRIPGDFGPGVLEQSTARILDVQAVSDTSAEGVPELNLSPETCVDRHTFTCS